MLNTPCGKIEVQGDEIFINNCNPDLKPADKQVLEVHRKYIDIQILLEGEETIGWKPLDDCTNVTKPYDEDADCALYDEPGTSYVTLKPGQFAIFWPEDGHQPCIGKGDIHKAIFKVKA